MPIRNFAPCSLLAYNEAMQDIEISVVIPFYNEEENVQELYERLVSTLEKLTPDFEILFVDDGSTDSSIVTLKRIQSCDKRVRILRLMRNFGQHPAMWAGFSKAQGKIVATLDADLQNPPEELPKLIAKLDEGYDVVSGWRQLRKDSFLRRAPSLIVNIIASRLTRTKLRDYGCNLRVYKREVVDELLRLPELAKFTTGLVSWLGVSIAEVEVAHDQRRAGKSKYNFFKLLKLYLDLVTGFTIFPVQLISITGAVVALMGLGLGLFLIGYRLFYGAGSLGITTFVALAFFISGVQLLSLGLIGEYVGRIYIEAQKRPYYIMKEEIES